MSVRLLSCAAGLSVLGAAIVVGPRISANDVEQRSQGSGPPAALVASFDGLGFGFEGPQGTATFRNPSDNSLAVGPNHVFQIVNSRFAVFTKHGALYDTTGRVLQGPAPTNTIFAGFGGRCEPRPNGDAVVRYDQLAERWLVVMPIFRRDTLDPKEPFSMCYAVSAGPDPLGPYHRYEFKRALFPDYPRPAVWPDGYYVPTSTGDDVIEKHACVVERSKMLAGLPAREQCIIIPGVNFLNNADIDGHGVPPRGAPNIMMATGGTQLRGDFDDDGIYVWKVHVDWERPENTGVSGPVKIPVAPYHYLCNGQLTRCVPQPDTTTRLDAQGDKLMARLVYRNVGGHESIIGLHSVNTSAGGGGVRWYEFRLDDRGDPHLYQQGTYAPDKFYRWMGSMAMDRQGNIGIGYSFGGTPHYPGQRFAARLADDPLGLLTLRETILVEGQAAQGNTLRWEDYTQTAMDPSDDCTIWYVGDYLRNAAPSYTSRIGAFRLPACLRGTVTGAVYFDRDHDGLRDPDEPGLSGWTVEYTGGRSGTLATDASGTFSTWLPADSAFGSTQYTLSQRGTPRGSWSATGRQPSRGVLLRDLDYVTGLDFGNVCVVRSRGAHDTAFWSSGKGSALLRKNDPAWRLLIDSTLKARNAGGSPVGVLGAPDGDQRLQALLKSDGSWGDLTTLALNATFGELDGGATVADPLSGDWPTIETLVTRIATAWSALPSESPTHREYGSLIRRLNENVERVTPSDPSSCYKAS